MPEDRTCSDTEQKIIHGGFEDQLKIELEEEQNKRKAAEAQLQTARVALMNLAKSHAARGKELHETQQELQKTAKELSELREQLKRGKGAEGSKVSSTLSQ